MAAFCFDRAVTHFGMHVENAVETAKSKAKSQAAKASAGKRVFDKYLYADGTEVKGRYADPAARRR